MSKEVIDDKNLKDAVFKTVEDIDDGEKITTNDDDQDGSKSYKNTKQGLTVKCPNCGYYLRYDIKKKKLFCDKCEKLYTEDELQNMYTKNATNGESDDKLFEYHCPSCGATVLADEHTISDFCAFCGNAIILNGRASGLLKPNLIIPFELSKEEAKKIFKDYLKGFSFVPSSFYKKTNLDKLVATYYPFWESDVDTDSMINVKATKSRSWVSGDRRYTKTDYYDVVRAGDIHLEDITESAFSGVDEIIIEGILPYPINKHKSFKIGYLSGFYAKKYNIKLERVLSSMDYKIKSYSRSLLLNTITGYDSVSVNGLTRRIKKQTYDYTLLPVYVLNCEYNNKKYTFAVNGVTGKVFGEVPLSKGKHKGAFFLVAGALFLLLFLLGGLFLW